MANDWLYFRPHDELRQEYPDALHQLTLAKLRFSVNVSEWRGLHGVCEPTLTGIYHIWKMEWIVERFKKRRAGGWATVIDRLLFE